MIGAGAVLYECLTGARTVQSSIGSKTPDQNLLPFEGDSGGGYVSNFNGRYHLIAIASNGDV